MTTRTGILPFLVAAGLQAACGEAGQAADAGADEDASGDVDVMETTLDVEDETLPPGWIGSPCGSEADCAYEDSICLTGAPDGMCTLACDLYCPDRDGYPLTFCVDEASLPAEAPGFTEGACFSRCDYVYFPGTGCREGYGCVMAPRANEPGTEVAVCMPGHESPPLTECQELLVAMGVPFEPTTHEPESPSSHPSLTCTIEDPVIIHPPIHGVDLRSPWGETPSILTACAMALALARTVDDVAERGVTTVLHMGTYNCRVISGTDRLSRHAYGDAVDFSGFEFGDGSLVTLLDHWEHDTDSPVTPEGAFLYDAAHAWYDAYVWNTILTPNYNVDHDDHFHVDLTPDSHFLGALPGSCRYIGPAPYRD